MRALKRGALWLVTFAIPVTIAACYGMVMNFYKPGKVLNKATQEGIKDIEVRCAEGQEPVEDAGTSEDAAIGAETLAVTGDDGSFVLYDDLCQTLRFVDVDGADNGGDFAPVEAPIGADGEELIVEMETTS